MAPPRAHARRRLRRQTCITTFLFLTQWYLSPLLGSEAFALRNLSIIPHRAHRQSRCAGASPITTARPPRRRCATTADDGLDHREETWTQDHVDGDGGEYLDEDDDAEDDFEVHPSAAWLNDPSLNLKKARRAPLGRTMAVDYGLSRVGLAVSVGISPRILPGVSNRGSDLEVVKQVFVRARGEGIRSIVVGFPLMRDGEECDMCHVVRSFALVLADAGAVCKTPTSVFLWDERFSSAQAEAMLDRYGGRMSKKVEIDSLAAGLILKHYFDAGGEGAEKVLASGQRTPEILAAAGMTGNAGGQGQEEELFGEDLKRKRDEERAESSRLIASGEFVPFMKPAKSKRKRR